MEKIETLAPVHSEDSLLSQLRMLILEPMALSESAVPSRADLVYVDSVKCYALQGPEPAGSTFHNVRYYELDEASGVAKLVFTPHHPVESALNMLLTGEVGKDVAAKVSMFTTDTVETCQLPMSQLMQYLLSQGGYSMSKVMKIDQSTQTLYALLKIHNPQQGYVHLLTAEVPLAMMFFPNGVIDVQLVAYIPEGIMQ